MAKPAILGRQAIYPWDKWLKYKNSFTLKKGEHYKCTTQSMALQFRARAARDPSISAVHIKQEDSFLIIKLERKPSA